MLEIKRAIDHINRLILTHENVLENNKVYTEISTKTKNKVMQECEDLIKIYKTVKMALEKQVDIKPKENSRAMQV